MEGKPTLKEGKYVKEKQSNRKTMNDLERRHIGNVAVVSGIVSK